jgi:hypothetical protein
MNIATPHPPRRSPLAGDASALGCGFTAKSIARERAPTGRQMTIEEME